MGIFDVLADKISKVDKEGKDTDSIGKVIENNTAEFIKSLSGVDTKRTKSVIDNLIVISSAAGGNGASTITSNLAYILEKKKLSVIVIDLNIMYPSQHIYYGLKQQIESPDLVSFLLGKNKLGDSIYRVGGKSIIYSNNRSIAESLDCESSIAISNFKEAIISLRQLYDVVIIDAPMKIDNLLINNAMYLADSIYLIWDEGISSISNTERIRKNLGLSGIDAYSKMKVIMNKKTSIFYSKFPIQKMELELLEVLPFDKGIIESGLRSEIFCHKASSNKDNANIFYTNMTKLADKILLNGGYIG